jgi:membrane fusion protein (multidrug efflux system)
MTETAASAPPPSPPATKTAPPGAPLDCEDEGPDHRHHLSRRLTIAGAAFVLVVLGVIFWRTVIEHPGRISTEDAYLETDLTPISARVAGYVRDVPVGDFQAVKAGQVLVRLVDDDYRAQADKAEADVAAAEAALANLKAQRRLLDANIASANAAVTSADATLQRNTSEQARQHKLIVDGVGSQQILEQADASARQSAAQLAQSRAQAAAARSQIDILAASTAQAEAALKGQMAALQVARLNLGYTRIVAPFAGVVGQRQVKPGQYLAVGGQVFSLAPERLWVIANFKETQITRAVVGQRAWVRVDAFPGKVLRGHLEAFSPASGAKFALLPADNATGNFTKIVQRIPVKIAIDDLDGMAGKLRAGMSVSAEIDTSGARPDRSQ